MIKEMDPTSSSRLSQTRIWSIQSSLGLTCTQKTSLRKTLNMRKDTQMVLVGFWWKRFSVAPRPRGLESVLDHDLVFLRSSVDQTCFRCTQKAGSVKRASEKLLLCFILTPPPPWRGGGCVVWDMYGWKLPWIRRILVDLVHSCAKTPRGPKSASFTKMMPNFEF